MSAVGANNRRLKFITFSFSDLESPEDVDIEFQCQVEAWQIVNNTPDGDKRFSFCYDPDASDAENELDGEFREEAEPDYQLTATLYADWRSNGISWFLTEHDGQTLHFRIDHHPNVPAEHVYWTGRVKIKAPSVGGNARTTEMTEMALPIIGKPESFRGDEESS